MQASIEQSGSTRSRFRASPQKTLPTKRVIIGIMPSISLNQFIRSVSDFVRVVAIVFVHRFLDLVVKVLSRFAVHHENDGVVGIIYAELEDIRFPKPDGRYGFFGKREVVPLCRGSLVVCLLFFRFSGLTFV